MNTNIRSILSASIALGLLSFAGISAFVLGVAASATLISFGLLAVYGMVEIAIASYQTPRYISSAASSRTACPDAAQSALVQFPAAERQVLARAA